MMRILVYGYGNPGRQDDGLGIALVEKLEAWALEKKLAGIEFDNNYQLNIEDAEAISRYDLVIFADASREEIDGFCLSEVEDQGKPSFTTHAASPGYIVKLCRELFQQDPQVLLLHIKGFEWEFREGLSPRAKENLQKALQFMKEFLQNPKNDLEYNIKYC